MQRLTYVNLDGEKVEFFHAPIILDSISGLGLPDLKFETIKGAYQQGKTIASFLREDRTVALTLHLMASNRSLMYENRLWMLGILSPDKAVRGEERAQLVYENDHRQYMTYAVPDGGLEAKKRFLNAQTNLKINFKCESPYWYDTATSSVTFAYAGSDFVLPFSFPIRFGKRDYVKTAINSGQMDAPVEVAITCKGESPRLYNRTTGIRLALNTPIPDGYTLILNTDPAKLDSHLLDANGNEISAFGKLSLETPLADFVLAPGPNELIYESGGANARSEITVTWRNAYEGV